MNRNLKNALKEGFAAPPPLKKNDYLCSIHIPSISFFEFIVTQITYIRKWIWILSSFVFLIVLISAKWIPQNALWYVSACMPLLALTILTESGRSQFYEMAEFELSTRFSLKSVVLARLGVIGISNLLLICLITPFIVIRSKLTILQTGLYMACPYLLTTFLGLWAVRKVHGKDGFYFCIGIALMVSTLNISISQIPIFYKGNNFIWWAVAFFVFGVGTAKQCYYMIKQTEELAWNL